MVLLLTISDQIPPTAIKFSNHYLTGVQGETSCFTAPHHISKEQKQMVFMESRHICFTLFTLIDLIMFELLVFSLIHCIYDGIRMLLDFGN